MDNDNQISPPLQKPSLTDQGLDLDKKFWDDMLDKEYYEQKKMDKNYKKLLAKWSVYVVSIWLLFVVFVLCSNKYLGFELSDPVIITLLGTSSLNVLGLSYIVLKGYFLQPSDPTPTPNPPQPQNNKLL